MLSVTARRIGATDVAPLLRLDPYRGPRDVFDRIVHKKDIEQSPVMYRGIKTEPVIRALGVKERGFALAPRDYDEPFVVQMAEHDFATASPDDLGLLDGAEGVVEYKSVIRWNAPKWGLEGTDQIPEHYLLQCHWLMAVTGLPTAWLLAAFGEDVKGEDKKPTGDFNIAWTALYVVRRDLELERHLLSVGERFWTRHVLPQIEPTDDWLQTLEAA